MKWKIYYGDGSTFSSYDGTPQLAPAKNVQVIVQEHPVLVWHSQARSDYYVWENRGGIFRPSAGPRWWGVDMFGLWEYLFDTPGYKCAKAGRSIEGYDYDEFFRQAKSDPMFGKKAAYERNEIRPDE